MVDPLPDLDLIRHLSESEECTADDHDAQSDEKQDGVLRDDVTEADGGDGRGYEVGRVQRVPEEQDRVQKARG